MARTSILGPRDMELITHLNIDYPEKESHLGCEESNRSTVMTTDIGGYWRIYTANGKWKADEEARC